MACFNPSGEPINPPRVWFRVQNQCSTEPTSNSNPIVFFPLTGENLPVERIAEEIQMIEKGNVLQYKKNSSNLTKQQRYSKIVTGNWVNKSSTLATQGVLFTDPNTLKLQRVNYNTIYADDGSPANLPVTCPEKKVIPIPRKLPPRAGSRPAPPSPQPPTPNPNVGPNSQLDPNYPILCPQYVDPEDYVIQQPTTEITPALPDKKNNKWAAMVLPEIKPSLPQPERVVIPDGGNFVCGPDDICPTPASDNREFYKNDYCNLTSDSDVPGPIQLLCYNNLKLTTFYPRVMRVMTSTGNKFPTGYKFNV